MRRPTTNGAIALLAILFNSPLAAQTQSIEILPSKDNTLYESTTGSLSNGSGGTLYFGMTNQPAARRALISFDVASSVPSGAVIDSVVLQITVTKTIIGGKSASVHRVEQDWGEGTSMATGAGGPATENDATWIHAFFDTQTWQSQGGDYDAAAMTSTTVGGGIVQFPSTAEFVSTVQTWLDSPDQNFGLILIGDENSAPTAKAIASRESSGANGPRLLVTYSVPTTVERDELPSFLTSFVVYPNPVTAEATVSYSLTSTREVRIDWIDVTGRLAATELQNVSQPGSQAVRIDTRNLTPGVYLVRLRSGYQTAARTVVVVN